jgi:hypothetical protein
LFRAGKEDLRTKPNDTTNLDTTTGILGAVVFFGLFRAGKEKE